MTATTAIGKQNGNPWYREPWPWILMAGPFIVIIAGLTTAWLAVTSSDGLVTDDYYKKGLAAGATIAKSQQAESLGITAGVMMTREAMQIRLSSAQNIDMPSALSVTLSHPTRAGLDQHAVLKRSSDVYRGEMLLPASGHWLVLVEDEAKTWRLMGSVMLPSAQEAVIGGAEIAKPRS